GALKFERQKKDDTCQNSWRGPLRNTSRGALHKTQKSLIVNASEYDVAFVVTRAWNGRRCGWRSLPASTEDICGCAVAFSGVIFYPSSRPLSRAPLRSTATALTPSGQSAWEPRTD